MRKYLFDARRFFTPLIALCAVTSACVEPAVRQNHAEAEAGPVCHALVVFNQDWLDQSGEATFRHFIDRYRRERIENLAPPPLFNNTEVAVSYRCANGLDLEQIGFVATVTPMTVKEFEVYKTRLFDSMRVG